MYEQLEKMSLEEVLRYAIASEDAAGNYYRSLVKFLSPNELVSHKFEHLAIEEDLHKKTLINLYKYMFEEEKGKVSLGLKGYVFPKGLPPLEGAIKVGHVDSFIEALEIALLSEDRAYNIYMYLAKKHKKHRMLFERLAMLEHGHYQVIKTEKQLCEGVVMEDPSLKNEPVHVYANYYGKLTL